MANYFSLEELTGSATARRLKIDNTPPPDAAARLEVLVEKLLNPVRELWGAPLVVNSGYRSPQLNRAIGGARNSQHILGEAADITTGSVAGNRRLFAMIVEAGFEFDQLIDERGYTWLHISYREGTNRLQILHLGVSNISPPPPPPRGRTASRRATRFVLIALLAAAMFFAGRGCAGDETGWGGIWGGGWCRAPTTETRVDTVIVRDTLRERVFVPVERRIARVDTVFLEMPASRDSVQAIVPIERVVYHTDNYRAVVEGFRPSLVELDIFRATTIVTKTPIPRRWSIGLQAGYGLTPRGAAPYLGLGVEYRLIPGYSRQRRAERP